MKRKICIITDSRAEYGILKPLVKEIACDNELQLQLVVTGAHLSPEFGLTYKAIEEDGFKIDEKIESTLSSDTPVGITKSMALTLMGCGEVFFRLAPDVIVILGDRYEMVTAAMAAQVLRIPIAHLYGGETTVGAVDEAFRHAITKMSCLHFVSTDQYRKRVIQLGEDPARVYNVGAMGIDNIKTLKLLSREELQNDLGVRFLKKNIIVTFHPVTLENNTTQQQFYNLVSVLEKLDDTAIVFTKTNTDTHGRVINTMIDEFVSRHKDRAWSFLSLGQLRYLSMLKHVDAVVGNSSSGIVEAPSFKIGTINIGDRQKGRLRADSIIDCEPTVCSIQASVERLYTDDFKKKLGMTVNLHGDGNAAKAICRILKEAKLDGIIKKHFFDVEFKCSGDAK
ncbi:MAG: UDP-N-acetylglucosamine 2-epimerase [Candidatus Wallbacteria bacterium]|nr:UDP-N-acetylglucosamine 2-epimerase [Candidatus Wallbacteria bacterium]